MSGESSKFLDPKAEVVFKKIFGRHPDLLKSFLNSILPFPKDQPIESLTYLTSEPLTPSLKNTIGDIRCQDQKGRIFLVEMHRAWNEGFMKRFLFETSKAYIEQSGRGLCPVYGVALVNAQLENVPENWFHHYRVTNVKDKDQTLEGLELVILELPKFNPKTASHTEVGSLWMQFLQETEDLEEIPGEIQSYPETARAMELARRSSYTPEELKAYEEYLVQKRVQ